MSRRCTSCAAERPDGGRFCESCGAPFSNSNAMATKEVCGPKALDQNYTGRGWGDYDWHLAGRLLSGVLTVAAVLLVGAAVTQRMNHTVDGRYVCGDAGFPMTIEISGSTGHMDTGVAHIRLMDVERHGDTISMSGGYATDADGGEIDSKTRAAVTGGDDVDLLKLGDDGQTLTMSLSDGRRVVFVKQP